MGILDEIEGHAIHAARTQASAGQADLEAKAYAKFANKRAGLILTVAAIGAFIPFLGWGITMSCWLFAFEYMRTLNPGKSGSDAVTVGLGWGILTWFITWATFALGFNSAENVEMLFFYGLAAVMVYFTFHARRHAEKLAAVTKETAEYISEQQS